MNIKDFLEAANYRVTGGSEFCWQCYGSNARYLDSECDKYSTSIIFDAVTQTVYEAHLFDYGNDRAYRWYNPLFKEKCEQEARERKVDLTKALDDINFGDTDSEKDILDKISAVVNGVEYDSRVTLDLDLSDAELLMLTRMAHDRDITLNQLIVDVLEQAVKELKV